MSVEEEGGGLEPERGVRGEGEERAVVEVLIVRLPEAEVEVVAVAVARALVGVGSTLR